MTDLPYEATTTHPDTEELAAYLSDGLGRLERSRLEGHLASCRQCRQEVVSARRLLQARPVWSRRSLMAPAVAAAILALALLGRGLLSPPVQQDTVRGVGEANEAETAPLIRVLSPGDQDTVPAHGVLFAWTGQRGRPLYRLTLTDRSGKAVWVRDTTDTALTLPASITLSPGRTYLWYVDALDSAGRSLTTGTRRFATAP